MFCGICVDVCPFEALFWSPEYEFSEPRIADLLHDKERLTEWMETVPDFEDYESGVGGQEAEGAPDMTSAGRAGRSGFGRRPVRGPERVSSA